MKTYLSVLVESELTFVLDIVEPFELLDETECLGETPFELKPSFDESNKSGLRPPSLFME